MTSPLQSLSYAYYLAGAIAFLAATVRVLYGWFRDYDNAVRFTTDMATAHLPYLYEGLQTIATSLGVPLKPPPTINFSQSPKLQA
jgi:hypothetical protein